MLETLRRGYIGRFPVWMVALGLTGVFLLFAWMRRRGSSSSAPSTDSTGTASDLVNSDNGSWDPNSAIYSYLGSDPTNPAYPVGGGTGTSYPEPITNVQWAKLAADYLIGLGLDPQIVSSALDKYINGKAGTLNPAENDVIGQALRQFHTPPEGIIPFTNAATPTPDPNPSPNPTPQPSPTPLSIQQGDLVKVNGRGAGDSYGGSGQTKLFAPDTVMRVVKVYPGRAYPYALNQYKMSVGVTGFWPASQLTKA